MDLVLGIELTGDWKKATQIMIDLPTSILPPGMQGMLKGEAELLLSKLRDKAIKKLKKPAPGTLLKRKHEGIDSKQTFVSTGSLMRELRLVKLGGGYFVGVDASATHNPSGQNLAKILRMHEKGFVQIIEATPAVMAKLAAIFGGLKKPRNKSAAGKGTGFIVVRVPPRPLFSELEKEIERDTANIIDRALKNLQRYLSSHGVETTIV